MYEILSLGYEFLSGFVPFLLVRRRLSRTQGRYAAPFSLRHYLLSMVFACYVIAVFHVTGVGTIYDAMTFRLSYLGERINLIPFSREIDLRGYLLNVVMLLPLGFLLPLIWKELGKVPHVFVTGFLFSLLIEVTQMLSPRGTDVDDLILNSLGAVAGFLLQRLWNRVVGWKSPSDGIDTMELPIYIVIIYLGRCLLFHQMGLIRLLYGG